MCLRAAASVRKEPGMITSDEPGLYLEGKYGIRLENLLLCVEKERNEFGTFLGFDPLTMCPFDLEAVEARALTGRKRTCSTATMRRYTGRFPRSLARKNGSGSEM